MKINVYTVDLKNEKKYIFNFNDEMMKYKKSNDRKLAFASEKLKKMVTKKYYSISHSYPVCVMAECDEPIGVDIENSNRHIEWEKIVRKRFSQDDEYPANRHVFFLDWTTREAYFKCTQDEHYLSATLDEIIKNYTIKTAHKDNIYLSICTKNEYEINDIDIYLSKDLD